MATDFLMSATSIFIYSALILASIYVYINVEKTNGVIQFYKDVDGLVNCLEMIHGESICVGNSKETLAIYTFNNMTYVKCLECGHTVIINEKINGSVIHGTYICREKDGITCEAK